MRPRDWTSYYAALLINADGSEVLYIDDIGLMQIDESLGRLTLSEVVDIWTEIFNRPPTGPAIPIDSIDAIRLVWPED
jgi:hypothetical protein